MDTLRSMSNLAWTLDREGNYAEAEKLERAALDGERRVFKTDNAETAKTMNNLAATLGHEGHFSEAEKMKRETLDVRRRILAGSERLDPPDFAFRIQHDLLAGFRTSRLTFNRNELEGISFRRGNP